MKKLLNIFIFICEIITLFSSCSFIYPEIENIPKIAFSFDDQYIDSWYPAFTYLKNKYPKFTASMFVCRPYKISESKMRMYKDLYNMGFEIGAHNWNHDNSVEYLNNYGEEAFKNMQYKQIDFWKDHEIDIKSFAYPYGKRNNETDVILSGIYDIVRSSNNNYVSNEQIKIIGSSWIDGEEIKQKTISIIDKYKNTNNILSFAGHKISENGGDCLTDIDYLEIFIQFAIENGYEFSNISEINKGL